MLTRLTAPSCLALVAALAMTCAAPSSVSAAPKQHGGRIAKAAVHRSVATSPRGKVYRNATRSAHHPRIARSTGYQPLYTDGRGSSFGFYPGGEDDPYAGGFGPRPFRPYRGNALRETMAIDRLTRGSGYQYGFPFE